jgi:hypothetical protein
MTNNLINKWGNELNRQFSKEETQMTNKQMKTMFNILSLQGNANQTTFHPVEIATIQKTNNNKCW